MKARLTAAVAAFCLFSCGSPPRDETPPTTTIPERPPTSVPPTSVPPTPVTPEPERADPGNYVRLERVPAILNGTSSQDPGLIADLQFMAWAGWRDPLKVADECPFACNGSQAVYFGLTCDELRGFGAVGQRLVQEGENQIVPQLQKENRRCNPQHRLYDERFLTAKGECARSEMRKTRLSDFRARLARHSTQANAMRDTAQRCRSILVNAGGKPFDSIAGWCSAMKRTGFTVSDCP